MPSKKNISDLEKEFTVLHNQVGDLIREKVETAQVLLNEAIKLSDEHGIPFETSLSYIDNQYIPSSFKRKFAHLDQDFLESLGIYNTDSGWQHSDIC